MKRERNYSLFADKSWAFRHFDGRRKEFRGITRQEFDAMCKKHWERAGRSVPTSQYQYEARRREIAYFATVPYEYKGDGMDDYNKYQRPASNGVGYAAICPGERANNHYVDDPILVAYLTKKLKKHFGSRDAETSLSYDGREIRIKSYFSGFSDWSLVKYETRIWHKFRVSIECGGEKLFINYHTRKAQIQERNLLQLLEDVCHDAQFCDVDIKTFVVCVVRKEVRMQVNLLTDDVVNSFLQCKSYCDYFKSVSIDPAGLENYIGRIFTGMLKPKNLSRNK